MNLILRYLIGVAVFGVSLFVGNAQAQAPANDSICNAAVLTVGATCNGVTNGDNTLATAENGEPIPGCFVGGANSVWFKFAGPASGLVQVTTNVTTTGTNDDTEIALYALPNGNCADFTDLIEIACDQDIDFSNYLSDIAIAPVIPGDTFYVQVSGWFGTEGDFCIEVNELAAPTPPSASNDTLCNAVALTMNAGCGGVTNGDNTNALFEIGEPIASCLAVNNSVWYTFVGPASGGVSISTDYAAINTNGSTEIAVFGLPGGNCADAGDLAELACESLNGGGGTSLDSLPVVAGATYYVQVVGGTGGAFCVTVDSVSGLVTPSNDAVCDAVELIPGSGCVQADNTGATVEAGEPFGACFNDPNPTIWYYFVGPASGLVSISTDTDSPFVTNDDTEIALYSKTAGAPCNDFASFTELTCVQDNGTNFPFSANVNGFPVTPGDTIWVRVSGWDGTEGVFCIELEELFIPTNDDVCDAATLPVDGTISDWFNIGATVQPGEETIEPPLGGGGGNNGWWEDTIMNSVWFKFAAPPSGVVQIDLCNNGAGNTDFDTQVAVYEVGDCNDFATFTFRNANDDIGCPAPNNTFASTVVASCLTPGDTLYVVVDGWFANNPAFDDTVGNFSISITEITLDPLTATIGDVIQPLCPGEATGASIIGVSGGTGVYTFSWSNGDSLPSVGGLTAGMYDVTVSDECDSTVMASVTINPAPVIAIDAGMDVTLCLGSTVQIGSEAPGSSGRPFSSFRGYGLDYIVENLSSIRLDERMW